MESLIDIVKRRTEELLQKLVESQPKYWALLKPRWNEFFEEAAVQARIFCK